MSSIVKVDTIQENTSANGITVDGLNIKDSKLVTADSVVTSNITDDAVTYAKIQNVSATDRILGRDSSGAGVIEEITPANLRTMINVADGANAYTHPNHSGEVTSTADGATVIADNIVDEANLKVSNSPTNGYFLSAQSGNTGGLTWAEAGGGGKVLQVVSVADTTARSTTSASFNTMSSALTLNITPSATSSKILVMLSTNYYITTNDGALAIFRGSTNLGHASYGHFYMHQNGAFGMATINYMDSPSTTSQVTYEIQGRKMSGGTLNIGAETGIGSLIAMEVGA